MDASPAPERRLEEEKAGRGAARPLLTAKDIGWLLYLYPGCWAAAVSGTLVRLLVWGAEPLFQQIARSARRQVEERLHLAFGADMSPSERLRVARRYISHAVRRAGDDLILARGKEQVRCRSFVGRERLDTALAAGRGVLLVSLHWFANRAACCHLMDLGYAVMSVRHRYPGDPRMGRVGRDFCQPRYIEFLHRVIRDEVFVQDPECSLKILRRLRAGGIVSIQLDARRTSHLIEHPFLGRPGQFPVGPFAIARTSGCSILPMFAAGHARSLEMEIGPPFVLDASLPADAYCRRYLLEALDVMERYVHQYPDQWDSWTKL